MTSEKQRAANQRNAQNSSGPSSAEGKAASRMNALKSGLYAKSAVIRGESQEEFEEIVHQYNEQFHPVTPQARTLVDALIRNTWLLRRYDRIEGELWETRFHKIDDFRHTDKRLPTALAFEMCGRLRPPPQIRGRRRTRHHPHPQQARQTHRALSQNPLKPEPAVRPKTGFVPEPLPPKPLGSFRLRRPPAPRAATSGPGRRTPPEAPRSPEKEAA